MFWELVRLESKSKPIWFCICTSVFSKNSPTSYPIEGMRKSYQTVITLCCNWTKYAAYRHTHPHPHQQTKTHKFKIIITDSMLSWDKKLRQMVPNMGNFELKTWNNRGKMMFGTFFKLCLKKVDSRWRNKEQNRLCPHYNPFICIG